MSEECRKIEIAVLEERGKGNAIVWAGYKEARVRGDVTLDKNHWTKIRRANWDIETLIETGRQSIDWDGLKNLGGLLFERLFPDSVQRLYDSAVGAGADSRLRIELVLAASSLADLPWEFLYDKNRARFLSTEKGTFVIRRPPMLMTPQAPAASPSPPLKILVVAACPVSQDPLDAAEECNLIRSSFKDLETRCLAKIDILRAATPHELHDKLMRDRYHVLHFIGHGAYDPAKGRGFLLFEKPGGRDHLLYTDELATLLNGRGIQLVVLNACKTAKQSVSDFNTGIGPALVVRGIPAVVAMQYSIPDVTAKLFSKLLYQSIALGMPVDEAVQEARIGVLLDIGVEGPDWGIPVLLTAAPPVSLFKAGEIAPKSPRLRKSAVRLKPMRFGLWDMDAHVGFLQEAARKLNSVQGFVEFVPLLIANPSGSVRIKQDGSAHCDAVKLFRQLDDAPSRFNVDGIFILTRNLIAHGNWANLFATSNNDVTLSVISTAGVRYFARRAGRTFEKAVFFIIFGELLLISERHMNYHKKTKRCLFDMCEVREDLIKGLKAMSIEEDCRKQVKNTKLLAAIEKMLATPLEMSK